MIAAGFWLGLVIGLVSGACFGVLLAGLLAAAASRDDEEGPRGYRGPRYPPT